MKDFEFKRCTRKCFVTGDEIKPGESYVSAVIETEEGVERRDFSETSWESPPEGCIGWWKSRIPMLEKGKIYWAPNRVLLAYFESILEKEALARTAYVMGILLVRKRILQWKESTEQDDRQFMHLRNTADKKNFMVESFELESNEIATIQNELAEQLFTDVAEDDGAATSADMETA